MLIKQVNIYDPLEESFKRCDLRIEQSMIKAIDSYLNEQEAEPWIDLSAYFAYPSFIESHCHLIGTGRKLIEPSLELVNSMEELKEIFKKLDEETLCLRGWIPDSLPYTMNRLCLDKLEAQRPVLLIGKCGHIGYVNTKAIELFKLEKFHQVDESNLEEGVIKERVLDFARACIKYSKKHLQDCLEQATNLCKSYGISSVHTDDWNTSSAQHLLSLLDAQTDLRIYEHLNLSPPFSYQEIMNPDTLSFYYRSTPFLSLSSFKFILDGSLGGRSAYLSSPYADEPKTKGVLYYSSNELQDILHRSERCGWSTAFHVIGDEALEVYLESFKNSKINNLNLKHRLIHVQMASSQQLDLINKLSLYLSIQSIFYHADKEMAIKRLSEQRFHKLAYPFKAMIDQNLKVSLSTDSPIEDINPFKNIQASETFMSRKKAFYCYTHAGAECISAQMFQGAIKLGNYADMFFLKEDLFSIPSSRLPALVPELIMFNGKWIKDINHLTTESEDTFQ